MKLYWLCSWLKEHYKYCYKGVPVQVFQTLKLITGVEFKWQKYQELTRELDKRRVIKKLEVKGEEELKDKI